MQISSLICFLHLMNLSHGRSSKTTQQSKRISSEGNVCPAGCATCSTLNGCLSCKPRLFFHLELDGFRQIGTCLFSCPRGHYGMRSPHISTCNKCKADCASCFSENFCTRCHPGHFLFRGKCEKSCPKGLTANTVLHECTECPPGCELCVKRNICTRCRADMHHLQGQCHHTCPRGFEPDMQLCIPQIHCEVGEWTSWGQCALKRGNRVYRRGEETRSRQVLRPPSNYGDPCPHVSDIRRCVIKKKDRNRL